MSTPTALLQSHSAELLSTGVPGLDDILGGGLTPNRLYLIEGTPGTGKTTLALQFLLEGVKQNESVLYITLSETKDELEAAASSHGWSLAGIHIQEILPSEDSLDLKDQYTVFHPAEVELSETTKTILLEVERVKPVRVVFDSVSELRLLAGNALQYRRQLLALKLFFAVRGCTVLVLDDLSAAHVELQGASIVHGVLILDQAGREYGPDRRHVKVAKYRGREYLSGYHDFVIRRGGMTVFPRLVVADTRVAPVKGETLSSGIATLDALLDGGLERGTSTLITGAPGTGKSTLAAQFAVAAARRGQRAALYIFDESIDTLLNRTDGLALGLRGHVEAGLVTLQQIDAGEMSPGEFGQLVLRSAQRAGTSVIVIDSLNGYVSAMPDERFLVIQLRALLSCLRQFGAITLLVGVHRGVIDESMTTGMDASYIADGIILMRYFEMAGQIRQAISAVKKRWGKHERTLREFSMSGAGIHVGEPLREFHGILTGVPFYESTFVSPTASEAGEQR